MNDTGGSEGLTKEDLQEKLLRLGLPFKAVLRMTLEELQRELNKIEDEKQKEHSDEEVNDILENCTCEDLNKLVERYGVRAENVTDDKTRKERIRYQMTKKFARHGSTAEMLGGLWDDTFKFKGACTSLAAVGEELERFLEDIKLDKKLRHALLRDYGEDELDKGVREGLGHLRKGECPIVVTGETSAGKSSFLNLLLEGSSLDGQHLELPNSEQMTTSCICEIKHGEERELRAHHNKPREGKTGIEIIKNPTIDTINKFLNVRHSGQAGSANFSVYKKIELRVPLDFLKCGIVLVDTPGVTGETEMKKFVSEYLEHSVAFIYILNKAVNVYQLRGLFEIESNALNRYFCGDTDVEELNTQGMVRNTMFIANKWDLVQDEKTMMSELEKTLVKYRVGNYEKQQGKLLKLMATRDRDHFRAGYVSHRFQALIDRFKETAPENMKLHLRKHYRYLQKICSRIEYHTQRFLNYAQLIDGDKEELKNIQADAEEKWQSLSQKGQEICKGVEEYISKLDVSEISDSLRNHFKNPLVQNSLLIWREEECPKAEEKFELTEREAKKLVKTRFTEAITQWENENHMLEDKRQELRKVVNRRLQDLNFDLTAVAKVLTTARSVELKLPGFEFRFCKMRRSVLDTFWRLFIELFLVKEKVQKAKFLKSPVESMEELAQLTLTPLVSGNNNGDGDAMIRLVRDLLGLDEVVKTLKEEIDKEIASTREEVGDLRGKEQVDHFRRTYQPILSDCLDLHTELLQWELHNLFEGDLIKSSDVRLGNERYLLGSGTIVGYYRGTQTINDQWKPVTVKRYALKDNLRTILRDYKRLKDWKSTCFGRAEGLIKLQLTSSADTELAVVMENCDVSLHNFLKTTDNLGGYRSSAVLTLTLPLAYDIYEALHTLHNECFVHGDLTTSTVMLTKVVPEVAENGITVSYRAKLYHIGVPTGANLERPKRASLSPNKFSAPETVDAIGCQPSMDVYGFGHILSELWYGKSDRAYKGPVLKRKDSLDGSSDSLTVEDQTHGQHSLNIEDVFIRTFTQRVYQDNLPFSEPSEEYKKLIIACCNKLPKERPSVDSIKNELEDIMKKYRCREVP